MSIVLPSAADAITDLLILSLSKDAHRPCRGGRSQHTSVRSSTSSEAGTTFVRPSSLDKLGMRRLRMREKGNLHK
jgi:hypothetical protein